MEYVPILFIVKVKDSITHRQMDGNFLVLHFTLHCVTHGWNILYFTKSMMLIGAMLLMDGRKDYLCDRLTN